MPQTKAAQKLLKELLAIQTRLEKKAIKAGQKAGAKILVREIKSRAPQETGRTKRSVKARVGKRKKDVISTNVVIAGGHDEPFIGFVEFGTANQDPNPFIRSSVAAKRDEVANVIRNAIDAEVRKGR